MFRKLSLFLLISPFLISSAFAQVDYMASWSVIRKSCTEGLTWNQSGVTKRPANCVELDPEEEEVLNKTLDFGFDPVIGPFSIEFELIKRSNDYFLRSKYCDVDGCEVREDPFDISMIDPYTLHKIANSTSKEPNNKSMTKSQVTPHRLFTLGPNTAALKNDYVVYTLDANDVPTGAKKVIFSNPSSKTALGASAAPDGGMAVQLTADSKSWTMSTRRLKDGLPIAAPFTWTVPAYSGYSPDITNAIEVTSAGATSRIRYLVFRSFRNVGTTSQQSQIMIQTIDDVTGKPIGDAKPLTSSVKAFIALAEAIQSIAIAPDGNLMLFTVYSEACKRQILKMVRLANSRIVGGATTLVGCSGLAATPAGVLGLDIMLPDEIVPATN
jgi:hypothetical protein